MYKLAKDISFIAHDIISKYVDTKNIAIDCTLGNGYDTDFLSEHFKRVISFDIQEEAVEKYKSKNKSNVELVLDSHDKLEHYIKEKADCILYNLGFLPGGDKKITTMEDSTKASIVQGLELLVPGGIMLINIYTGHNEGRKEKTCILNLTEKLSKNKYGVVKFEYVNRNGNAPLLICIEKNQI